MFRGFNDGIYGVQLILQGNKENNETKGADRDRLDYSSKQMKGSLKISSPERGRAYLSRKPWVH